MPYRTVAALCVAGLVASTVIAVVLRLSEDDGPPPKASTDRAALFAVYCGLHEYQRDQGALDVADDDVHTPLWELQVALSSRFGQAIAKAMKDADWEVQTVTAAGSEPDEDAFEEARERVDEECDGVDAVAPDADLYADSACLFARYGARGRPRARVEYTVRSFASAAAGLDRGYQRLENAAWRLGLKNGRAVRVTGRDLGRFAADRCADLP